MDSNNIFKANIHIAFELELLHICKIIEYVDVRLPNFSKIMSFFYLYCSDDNTMLCRSFS